MVYGVANGEFTPGENTNIILNEHVYHIKYLLSVVP